MRPALDTTTSVQIKKEVLKNIFNVSQKTR